MKNYICKNAAINSTNGKLKMRLLRKDVQNIVTNRIETVEFINNL